MPSRTTHEGVCGARRSPWKLMHLDQLRLRQEFKRQRLFWGLRKRDDRGRSLLSLTTDFLKKPNIEKRLTCFFGALLAAKPKSPISGFGPGNATSLGAWRGRPCWKYTMMGILQKYRKYAIDFNDYNGFWTVGEGSAGRFRGCASIIGQWRRSGDNIDGIGRMMISLFTIQSSYNGGTQTLLETRGESLCERQTHGRRGPSI